MAVQTEGKYLGDWLKWEVDEGHHMFCRDVRTILAGSGADRVLTTGMVVGKITASGKIVQINFGASDGSETAFGVLIADITAVNGTDNPKGVVLVRGPAIISDADITWPAGATGPQKTTALAALLALGIKAGQGV